LSANQKTVYPSIRVNTSAFFDYPGQSHDAATQALVFLPDLDEAGWRTVLGFTQRRVFRAGEEVLRAGEPGRALFIVVRGELDVALPQKRGRMLRIGRLVPGSVFGEQAFLDGEPRSATVRALADGEMHALSLDAFEVLAARHPDLARAMLLDLGRIVSLRLRQVMALAAGGAR
jgi:CRP/FNR family transcriptional regulator, cyclic AMP receptor protein